VNLIPGEVTVGPLFAGMGIGYVGVAIIALRGRTLLLELGALYTGTLLLAYVASRLPIDTPLPIEPIGVALKVDEAVLLAVLVWYITRHAVPQKSAG